MSIDRIDTRPPLSKRQAQPTPAGRNTESSAATRLRILDAAEHLFAENGVDGTSLRRIMAAAEVSISQINYHFGTKEAVLRAIFERRGVPHIQERMRLIIETRQIPAAQRLDALLRAYFVPVRWHIDGASQVGDFNRLLGRIGGDPGDMARSILAEYFDGFQRQFIAELKSLLPRVPEEDLFWRWHCLLGILMYSATNLDRLHQVSGGRFDVRDGDAFLDHVIPVLVHALRAPPPKKRGLPGADGAARPRARRRRT